MTRWIDQIAILNSAVRTLIALVLSVGAGIGGWYGYNLFNENERTARDLADAQGQLHQLHQTLSEKEAEVERKAAEIRTLQVTVADQLQQIENLDTRLRLMKVDHRMARLKVLDQTKQGDAEDLLTLVEFQELDPMGLALGDPKRYQIRGDIVYIDSWVVKFDDKYVEAADLDRSSSLVLFRRIFGEYQEPRDGFSIDSEGERPAVYGRGGVESQLERKIWSDFWNVANDPVQQAELGIRAAHGDAPSIKVRKGKSYRIDLRASGGLSIVDEGTLPGAAT